MTETTVICLRDSDDVAVAVATIPEGTSIAHAGQSITARQAIPAGHKIAIRAVAEGAPVYKYAVPIGMAKTDIESGDHVHVHNLAPANTGGKYEFSTDVRTVDYLPAEDVPTFDGYARADGRAGTRNYIALISTVNCSATVTHEIAQQANEKLLQDYPNVDGVAPFAHFSGCSPKRGVAGYDDLTRVLAGIAKNPNVGGYLVIGLGCEGTQPLSLIEDRGLVQIGRPDERPPVITLQECGGVRKTIAEGLRVVAEMLPRVNDITRTPQPISKIMLATECGGSDAYSGITANPAVGNAVDRLVQCGGTAILSETTEIYGAEHLMTRRAVNRETGEKLLDLLKEWDRYLTMYGMQCNNNPSRGNIDGGLSNIVEKSLGAVAKSGTTPLQAVYGYAETVTESGLVIMDSPGYDPPSVAGMVAGGANMVTFTTGRGSCFGLKPAPVIKIATNTPMYEHMRDDMDVNAGTILQGVSVEDMGGQILAEIIAVASGKQSCSERNEVGDHEFIPWVRGATV
jgi:altronate hydrolase